MNTSTARITRFDRREPYLATTASVKDGLVSLHTHTTASLAQNWWGAGSRVSRSREAPNAATLKYPDSNILLGETAMQLVSSYLERGYFGHTITSTTPSNQEWLARTIACSINTASLPTDPERTMSSYVVVPMQEYIGSALFTVVRALEQADLTQINSVQFMQGDVEAFQIPDVR
jgi:hypothetical protein